MRKFEQIVESNVEPDKSVLWLKNGKLRYFGTKGWSILNAGGIGVLTDEGGAIVNGDANNKASAEWALSTGESTSALGYASATFNENTVANNIGESAFGIWNVSNNGADEALQTLFSVGFGTGENPANAYESMRNGDFYLYGVGGYNGVNGASVGSKSLQQVIADLGGNTPSVTEFDASELYVAYTQRQDKKVTPEFKKALIDSVKNGDILFITDSNPDGLSFKVMVVFAGNTKEELFFTASDHVAHYQITLNLATDVVTLSITDIIKNYVINVSNTPEAKAANMALLEKVLDLGTVETVRIQGTYEGKVTYDTIGIYNSGSVTALEEGKQLLFDVSFTDGTVTLLSSIDVTKVEECVTLEVGDSAEIKARNLEMLPQGTFQACLEYGYGVGTFQAATGGFVHTTTAKGNEIFYDIKSDGTITKNDSYVKPNEPYTLTLEAGRINQQLTDIEASALKKAGELVILTSSGPVTYTRTEDSTDRMVYFTDSRKDGKTVLLSYNDTNKLLGFSEVPMARATESVVGGITQGAAIADASFSDAVDKFNQLLGELRKSGVIANN